MHTTLSLTALTLLVSTGGTPSLEVDLTTDYALERTLRIERVTRASQQTTEFAMERDGVPLERPGGFGGGERASATTVVWLDTVRAHEDGRPTEVERVFERVELASGEEGETEDSELSGETASLNLGEDGEVEAEAAGVDPERLAGQVLTLQLDALLPEESPVSPGESWELDAEDLRRALGVDVFEAMFPRPEPDRDAGRERGRGERGERPAFLRRDSSQRLLRAGEWEGTATLAEETLERDGLRVAVIELEFEGEGALEDERGFRGPRGRRALRPLRQSALHPAQPGRLAGTEFEFELEGRLLVSVEERRPVALDLEGSFVLETESVRDTEDGVFSMYSAQEGTFEQSVRVTVEESE